MRRQAVRARRCGGMKKINHNRNIAVCGIYWVNFTELIFLIFPQNTLKAIKLN